MWSDGRERYAPTCAVGAAASEGVSGRCEAAAGTTAVLVSYRGLEVDAGWGAVVPSDEAAAGTKPEPVSEPGVNATWTSGQLAGVVEAAASGIIEPIPEVGVDFKVLRSVAPVRFEAAAATESVAGGFRAAADGVVDPEAEAVVDVAWATGDNSSCVDAATRTGSVVGSIGAAAGGAVDPVPQPDVDAAAGTGYFSGAFDASAGPASVPGAIGAAAGWVVEAVPDADADAAAAADAATGDFGGGVIEASSLLSDVGPAGEEVVSWLIMMRLHSSLGHFFPGGRSVGHGDLGSDDEAREARRGEHPIVAGGDGGAGCVGERGDFGDPKVGTAASCAAEGGPNPRRGGYVKPIQRFRSGMTAAAAGG